MSSAVPLKSDTEAKDTESLPDKLSEDDICWLVDKIFWLAAEASYSKIAFLLFIVHKADLDSWFKVKNIILGKAGSNWMLSKLAEVVEISSKSTLSGSCPLVPNLCTVAQSDYFCNLSCED